MHRLALKQLAQVNLRAAGTSRPGGNVDCTNQVCSHARRERTTGQQEASASGSGAHASGTCDWNLHSPIALTAVAASLACGHQLCELRSESSKLARDYTDWLLPGAAAGTKPRDVDIEQDPRQGVCALRAVTRRAFAQPVFTTHRALDTDGLPLDRDVSANSNCSRANSDDSTVVARLSGVAKKRVTFDVQCQTTPASNSYIRKLANSTAAFEMLLNGQESQLNLRIGLSAIEAGLKSEGFKYITKAFETSPDDVLAIYNLAMCYAKGYGAQRDYKKAYTLWQRGAELGDGACMYQMAVCQCRKLVAPDTSGSAAGDNRMDLARALLARAHRKGFEDQITKLASEFETLCDKKREGARKSSSTI